MKKKSIITLLAILFVGLGANSFAAEQQKAAAKKQTTCPVMGGKVDASSPYVDVDGKRIYVCCPKCAAKVKANPEKYIKKLEAEGVTLPSVSEKTKPAQPKSCCGAKAPAAGVACPMQ